MRTMFSPQQMLGATLLLAAAWAPAAMLAAPGTQQAPYVTEATVEMEPREAVTCAGVGVETEDRGCRQAHL